MSLFLEICYFFFQYHSQLFFVLFRCCCVGLEKFNTIFLNKKTKCKEKHLHLKTSLHMHIILIISIMYFSTKRKNKLKDFVFVDKNNKKF